MQEQKTPKHILNLVNAFEELAKNTNTEDIKRVIDILNKKYGDGKCRKYKEDILKELKGGLKQ